jgi:diaminopimelate epimerase
VIQLRGTNSTPQGGEKLVKTFLSVSVPSLDALSGKDTLNNLLLDNVQINTFGWDNLNLELVAILDVYASNEHLVNIVRDAQQQKLQDFNVKVTPEETFSDAKHNVRMNHNVPLYPAIEWTIS